MRILPLTQDFMQDDMEVPNVISLRNGRKAQWIYQLLCWSYHGEFDITVILRRGFCINLKCTKKDSFSLFLYLPIAITIFSSIMSLFASRQPHQGWAFMNERELVFSKKLWKMCPSHPNLELLPTT